MSLRDNLEAGLSEPGGRLSTSDRLRTYFLGAGIGLVLSGMVIASWWFRRPTEMPNRGAFSAPPRAANGAPAGTPSAPAQPAPPRELSTGAGR